MLMCTYCQRKSGYCRTIFSSGRSVRVQGHLHLCSWAVHLDSIESDFQISRVMSTLHGSSSERKRERGERRHCWRQEGTRAWRYKDTATMWATPHLKPCFHVQFTAEPWWFQIWLSGTTDTVSADGVCATRSPPLGCQVRPGQACSPSGSHFSSLAAAHVTGEKNFCKAMMS